MITHTAPARLVKFNLQHDTAVDFKLKVTCCLFAVSRGIVLQRASRDQNPSHHKLKYRSNSFSVVSGCLDMQRRGWEVQYPGDFVLLSPSRVSLEPQVGVYDVGSWAEGKPQLLISHINHDQPNQGISGRPSPGETHCSMQTNSNHSVTSPQVKLTPPESHWYWLNAQILNTIYTQGTKPLSKADTTFHWLYEVN